MASEERNAYNRAWYAKNRARLRVYHRAWKAAHPEETEKSRVRMKRLRDADPEKYRSYQRKYAGLPIATRPAPAGCECCGRRTTRALCLDHDHEINAFRGWLCFRCNIIAGRTRADIDRLKTVLSYLEKFYGKV